MSESTNADQIWAGNIIRQVAELEKQKSQLEAENAQIKADLGLGPVVPAKPSSPKEPTSAGENLGDGRPRFS
jgi:hypothetical protein